jgi:TetR/AcrR family transcriptional repressor of nem operon
MVDMGRLRSFDEHTVVAAASAAFTDLGYEATSIEDLLQATGLHRGSLYQAFGSKRGLFLAALRAHLSTPADLDAAPSDPGGEGAARADASAIRPAQAGTDPADATLLDLLLVATLELAPRDEEVRALVARALLTQHTGPEDAALLLGRRLLARAHIAPTQRS